MSTGRREREGKREGRRVEDRGRGRREEEEDRGRGRGKKEGRELV